MPTFFNKWCVMGSNKVCVLAWLLALLTLVAGELIFAPPVFSQDGGYREDEIRTISERTAREVVEAELARSGSAGEGSLLFGVFLGGGVFCLGAFFSLVVVGAVSAATYFFKRQSATSSPRGADASARSAAP